MNNEINKDNKGDQHNRNNEERDIIDDIGALVAEERTLRDRSSREMGLAPDERSRLHAVEIRLGQCWDLLRQRRALREAGEDPSTARIRSADEVEGYQS
ncbi:DUF2630 family protein [Streptomyces sp. NPDC001455]|uniref:DUF2630 family protein n=1 Tax=unclassified Streptomyces TaxID=2593676 RepID=UPI00331C542B